MQPNIKIPLQKMSQMRSIFGLLTILVFSLAANASEKPFLISGFDDVLRQAENTGLLKAAIKIFESDKTFSGMPELYSVITKDEQNPKFVLVSAISNMFDGRIENLLTETKYPAHRRYLRNWFTQWSIENFKIDRIKEIIAERPNRNFIVIFDNSNASLVLAKELNKLFPTQIKAIYLRQVVEKEIPSVATLFYTAFDIALKEYAAGRMKVEEVKVVGDAVVKERNKEMLFPSYASCPKSYAPCNETNSQGLEDICSQIQSHVRNLCLTSLSK